MPVVEHRFARPALLDEAHLAVRGNRSGIEGQDSQLDAVQPEFAKPIADKQPHGVRAVSPIEERAADEDAGDAATVLHAASEQAGMSDETITVQRLDREPDVGALVLAPS